MTTIKSQKVQCDKCEGMFKPREISTYKGKNLCGECLVGDTEHQFVDAAREEFYASGCANRNYSAYDECHIKLRPI